MQYLLFLPALIFFLLPMIPAAINAHREEKAARARLARAAEAERRKAAASPVSVSAQERPAARKPGRPRKYPPQEKKPATGKRGRPRKQPLPQEAPKAIQTTACTKPAAGPAAQAQTIKQAVFSGEVWKSAKTEPTQEITLEAFASSAVNNAAEPF